MRYYRRPKTTQEKRANIEHKNSGLVRGRRHSNRLVSYYDDIPNNTITNKSWKDRTKNSKQYINKNDMKVRCLFCPDDNEQLWQYYLAKLDYLNFPIISLKKDYIWYFGKWIN